MSDTPDAVKLAAQCVSKEYEADVYVYSGLISGDGFGKLVTEIGLTKQQAAAGAIPQFRRAILMLTTSGGHANSAFQIARLFQTEYSELIVFAPSYCKSAGTIVALGAHRLIMDVFSEIGPLDVQLPKENEIFGRRSGLLMRSAFESLQEVAFDLFEYFMLEITQRSLGVVGFKIASEISTAMASGLLAPVYAQINPDVVGSDYRDSQVALQYGIRLVMISGNATVGTVRHLVEHYPSHDFIIDAIEARELFKNVDKPLPILYDLSNLLVDTLYVEQDPAVVSSLVTVSDDAKGGGNERRKEGGSINRGATSVDAGGEGDRPSDSKQGGDDRQRHADGVSGQAAPLASGEADSGIREDLPSLEILRRSSGDRGEAEKMRD